MQSKYNPGSLLDLLRSQEYKVTTYSEIKRTIESNRDLVGIPRGFSCAKLLRDFVSKGYIKRDSLNVGVRKETRYILEDISPYELALCVRPASYLTHQTAAYINHLTERVSNTIFANSEQGSKEQSDSDLDQENIDNAFRSKQRISKSFITYKRKTIRLLSGQYTDQLGVIQISYPEGTLVRCTDVERTLIDMTVRPAYAGGVAEVLSAYKHAHGRLSLQRLVDYLAKLAYKYPYHQAIGFYLTRSGNYTREDLLLLSEIGMNFDFYLCHGIKRMRFDKTWRLHYPAELDT